MTRIRLRTHSPRLEWLELRAVPAVVGAESSAPETAVIYTADENVTTAVEVATTTDAGSDPLAIGVLPTDPTAPPPTDPVLPPPTGGDQPPLVDPIIPPSTNSLESDPLAIGVLPTDPTAPPPTDPVPPPPTGGDQPPLVDPIIPPSQPTP